MPTATKKSVHPGGRPPKFKEPSRPITVTLPDRILENLRGIDADRAKAIVKAVDVVSARLSSPRDPVEMVEMAPGVSLLVVPTNQSLRAIPWLRMIEVAPTRHLLLIEPGTPIEKVEVALSDLIEDATNATPHEVPMLASLREKLGVMRRGGTLTKAEVLCVESK